MQSKRRDYDAMFHATKRQHETRKERVQRQYKDWQNKHFTDRYEKFKPHHWSSAIKSEGKSDRKGEAYYQRGTIYKQREKFEWALDDFKQAKRLLPKDSQSHKWARFMRKKTQVSQHCSFAKMLESVFFGPSLLPKKAHQVRYGRITALNLKLHMKSTY